jgi:hypothetical protein
MPEQVEALIDYVTVEPEEDSEQKTKFLYPYKSSEVHTGSCDCKRFLQGISGLSRVLKLFRARYLRRISPRFTTAYFPMTIFSTSSLGFSRRRRR